MKKAVIFLNGDLAQFQPSKDLSSQDLIICANGGTKAAIQLGIHPKVVIGDFDSLPKQIKEKLKNQAVKLLTYPKEKDKTDAELALDYAKEKNYQKIIIYGLLGRRVDHLVANILLLAQPKYASMDIKIIEGNQEIFLIREKKIIKGKKGELLSLIPVAEDVFGISTTGLKYQLNNDTLLFGSSRGISNILTKEKATICLTKGLLLAVHQKNQAEDKIK